MLKFNNIEVGTEFRESALIEIVNAENQGKAIFTYSFINNSLASF